jgi:phosphoribosylglycinamide formyltransferase-1
MNSRSSPPLPIAVLISGGGTTLRNLLDKIDRDALPITIRRVISSHGAAGGLKFAREAQIPTRIVRRRDFASAEAHSQAVFDICRQASVGAVAMAGYLEHVLIPSDFENRVLNIHPALIPAFCGHGFYGHRVHQAVLDYGAKISGCTVHFVDNQYDHGPINLQRPVPVAEDDTPETLAARVFQAECQAYPEALHLLATGRLQVVGRRVQVLP